MGDDAELMVRNALSPPIVGGFKETELGLVVGLGVVEATLIDCRITSEVMQYGEFILLYLSSGFGVAGYSVVKELAAGRVLLCLVEVLLQRLDQGTGGLTSFEPVGEGGG